jgi:hypothetical protein
MENGRLPQEFTSDGPHYTNLFAYIIEEGDGFTVQVRLISHFHPQQAAWGEEIADTFETASAWIAALAEQYSIPQAGIRIEIRMQEITESTQH